MVTTPPKAQFQAGTDLSPPGHSNQILSSLKSSVPNSPLKASQGVQAPPLVYPDTACWTG